MKQETSFLRPVQGSLHNVELNLRRLAESSRFSFLTQLLDHVFNSEGKRLRPALTLLAGGFNPHPGNNLELMATAVEMLHMATLIHDDTVDNADFRRGKATVGKIWGRNVAVLVGDYTFAASAVYVCDTNNTKVIRRFSQTIMDLSSGELQELEDAYNINQDMAKYMERIYFKTASLFETAGETGAILSGAREEIVGALRNYGRNLGLAFQIMDDILDYEGDHNEIGKPVGSDLAQGILTLPAILALSRQCENDNAIASFLHHPCDNNLLHSAFTAVKQSGALSESHKFAEDLVSQAVSALDLLPNNESRASLEELAGFVLRRTA